MSKKTKTLLIAAVSIIIGFIFLYEFPFSNAKTNFKPSANKTFGKYPGVKF
jgi:uncharacterized membrane protein